MAPTASSGLTEPTPAGTPEKAEIHVYNDPTSTDGTASKVISCMFRPTQLSFSKSASWNPPVADDSGGGKPDKKKDTATQKGQNVPTVEFSGGQAASITLDLLFNTTDTGEDVRIYTDELVNLTLLQTAGGVKPPPVCRFVWGKIRSFLAYVGSVTITFKMFLSDGTPVRADAKVSLTQYKDDGVFKKQNPTSFRVRQLQPLAAYRAHQRYPGPPGRASRPGAQAHAVAQRSILTCRRHRHGREGRPIRPRSFSCLDSRS
jgi:hypothetical protein